MTAILPGPDEIRMKPEDSVCGCDADSCYSSEKCYCSLRGDPRQNKRVLHSKTELPPQLSGSSTQLSRSRDMASSDSGTDMTCFSTRHTSHNCTNWLPSSRDISLSR
jgi:hypothetical protein